MQIPLSGLPLPVTVPLIWPVFAAAAALTLRPFAASVRSNDDWSAARVAAGFVGLRVATGTLRTWPIPI